MSRSINYVSRTDHWSTVSSHCENAVFFVCLLRCLQLFCIVETQMLQEEEALLNEMEVTGQAFEDMQEQNSRLIQQLREKDDANFKLMSERIKANSLHKLLREEKQLLQEQVSFEDIQEPVTRTFGNKQVRGHFGIGYFEGI